MKIAVDLLWLRVKQVGGTEFYIRNLLDGFAGLEEKFELVLLTSRDNEQSFRNYIKDSRFSILIAPINSAAIGKRIIWQNIFQNSFLKKNGIRHCFIPVYCRPFLNGGIAYINTIHDIQIFYYPKYHPLYEVWYTKLCWFADFYKSQKIIATTDYVKSDLIKTYKINENRIKVLNIPISINKEEKTDFLSLSKRFQIERQNYYYTVAQIIPHKNLPTIIRLMARIKEQNLKLPDKLLISGINGNGIEAVRKIIKECHVEDKIILTGFVSNGERNALYENARAFLFPSIFEGFGMPPIEAMMIGAMVITTECTSIPEVTQYKANYVKDPYNLDEWVNMLQFAVNNSKEIDINKYNAVSLAKEYLDFMNKTFFN